MANNSALFFLWLLVCVSARQIPERDYHREYSEKESSDKQQHHLQSPRHGDEQRAQEDHDANESLRSNEIYSDEYPVVIPKT